MTEDEAKTKWCFAAVASHTDPRRGFEPPPEPSTDGIIYRDKNAPASTPKQFPCIASACMAWRWASWKQRVTSYDPGYGDKTNGYCGLAGKP